MNTYGCSWALVKSLSGGDGTFASFASFTELIQRHGITKITWVDAREFKDKYNIDIVYAIPMAESERFPATGRRAFHGQLVRCAAIHGRKYTFYCRIGCGETRFRLASRRFTAFNPFSTQEHNTAPTQKTAPAKHEDNGESEERDGATAFA